MDIVEGTRVRFDGATTGTGFANGRPWRVKGEPVLAGVEGVVTEIDGYGYAHITLDDGSHTKGDLVFLMQRVCVVVLDKRMFPHVCPRCTSACYLGAVPSALDCTNAKCPSKTYGKVVSGVRG